MRFVVLISIHAILLSFVREAIIQSTINRDQAAAELFWIRSIEQ